MLVAAQRGNVGEAKSYFPVWSAPEHKRSQFGKGARPFRDLGVFVCIVMNANIAANIAAPIRTELPERVRCSWDVS
jgi:hypothetical protein